jgi:hypothetical protein
MDQTADLGIIRAKAGEMTRHLICALLDSLFLGLWALPNVYIGRFIEGLHVAGIDAIVLRCLQVLFGISTLAPICIWIYKDISIMLKHANQEIKAAGLAPVAIALPSGNGQAVTENANDAG